MNTSYTKRRRIQEANALLEKRLITEQTKETALANLKKNNLMCVSNGTYQLNFIDKKGTDNLGNYFLMKIDGVEYYLNDFGDAYEKNNPTTAKKYSCENGVPKISQSEKTTSTQDYFEPRGKGCVKNGKMRTEGGDGPEFIRYVLNVNGIDYEFTYNWAYNTKNNTWWLYKCENDKPVVYSPCDTKSQEFSGKQNDTWEYKALTELSDDKDFFGGQRMVYCTRKKGTEKWIWVDPTLDKYEKADEAIDKLYNSQKNNTSSSESNQTTQNSDNTTDNQNKSNTRTDANY